MNYAPLPLLQEEYSHFTEQVLQALEKVTYPILDMYDGSPSWAKALVLSVCGITYTGECHLSSSKVLHSNVLRIYERYAQGEN